MPSPDDCATLQAWFEGVDHARAEAEAEWGVGRLPLLVDAEMRAKFNRQQVRWSGALQEAWAAKMLTRDQLAAVQAAAGGMTRAWAALGVAATEAGHRPIFPDVWEARLADGSVAAVVRTDAEASKVIAEGRHVCVYTLSEVANLIDALPPALALAKVVFPGAKVLGDMDRSWLKAGPRTDGQPPMPPLR
jgi:hypothetical protein